MRPKGLTQAEIEKFANFDWDDSADEENEEEEDANMERIIEETLKNLDNRAENMQVGLIDQFITTENDDWCINSSLVNSWLLYRRDITHTDGELKHMPLINFQLDVATELLNASQTTVVAKKRGRPSSLLLTMNSGTSSPSPSTPSSPAPSSPAPSTGSESNPYKRAYVAEPAKSLRFDGYNHWPEWGTRGRRRVCNTGFPSCKCSKCNVRLCSNPQKNCFVSYHT